MNTNDVDVIARVLRDALAAHKLEAEGILAERAKEFVSKSQAVDITREALAEAEERLRRSLEHQSTEIAKELQRAAAADLVRLQNLLIERTHDADTSGARLSELRADVERTTAAMTRDVVQDAVSDAEGRLRTLLDQQSSEGMQALKRSATEEILRAQTVLFERLEQANALAVRLAAMQSQLQEAIEAVQPPPLADVAQQIKDDAAFVATLKGGPGARGDEGPAGAGIEAPVWAPGIYREGTLVQAYVGQFYRCLKDTDTQPYRSPDWQRVGTCGLHFAEPYAEGRTYETGDVFVRDYGTFAYVGGEAVLVAGRGAKGEPGLRGVKGDTVNGKDGIDGASIDGLELRGSVLAIVTRTAGGVVQAHDVDFLPLLETLGEAIEERFAKRFL